MAAVAWPFPFSSLDGNRSRHYNRPMRKRNVHMPEGGEGRMKFGKMLLIALLCGLFLLLLSALVVAPETETVLPENLPLTGLEMSACALPVWADAGDSASRWFWMPIITDFLLRPASIPPKRRRRSRSMLRPILCPIIGRLPIWSSLTEGPAE